MLYVSLELMMLIIFLQYQCSVVADLDETEIVIAARPDLAFGVLEDRRDTGDAFRMDDAPLGIVVIEQSFKVGEIDNTVLVNGNVKIVFVSSILLRAEVLEERQALGRCTSQDKQGQEEDKQQCSCRCSSSIPPG